MCIVFRSGYESQKAVEARGQILIRTTRSFLGPALLPTTSEKAKQARLSGWRWMQANGLTQGLSLVIGTRDDKRSTALDDLDIVDAAQDGGGGGDDDDRSEDGQSERVHVIEPLSMTLTLRARAGAGALKMSSWDG